MTALVGISREALTITSYVAVMMLIIDYANVYSQGAWQAHLANHKWGQLVLAAFLGAVPGCLGAFAVVGMYTHGVLTRGALIAAMIATMGDEAFVMLALMPGQALLMTGILFLLGIGIGALSDTVSRFRHNREPAGCEALVIHEAESCRCLDRDQIVQQWKTCSAARGLLSFSLSLLILGLLTGQIGPPAWDWTRVTLFLMFAVALFLVATVPDHFLEEHLWRHVVRKHVLTIFCWTLGALLCLHVLTEHLHLETELERGRWILLVVACLVGLIPESGPHLVFVTLYAQGIIPLSILLASSIVQDGHGMLPLLAHSRITFLEIKAVNFLVGMLIGGLVLLIGW
jgi:hypothetical protein